MPRRWIGAMGAAAIFAACTTSDMDRRLETRLQAVEAKQDSLLVLLQGMQGKHDYMARRMGWQPPPDTGYQEIPVGSSFTDGADNPVLTIVEFSDLQCPYCARSAPVLDSLTEAYPEKIRVVFKHFPLSFHPQAREAAAAAIAAGRQGKFFEFRYRIAPHYQSLGDSLYLAMAQELGLDMERFRKDMALTPEINRILDADMELGRRVGVQGTPTFFVNGRLALDRSFDYFVDLMRSAERDS